MKKIYLLSFTAMVWMSALVPGVVRASDFEIVPIIGYSLGGGFEDSVTGTQLEVDDSTHYGIILDFKDTPVTQIELYYSLQPTRLKSDGGALVGNPLFDMDIHYIHVGGTYMAEDEKVKPYVVGTFGATYMDPKKAGLDSETRLSMSLGGGVKLFMTDRIGLRLEGRGFGTYFGNSSAAFCGSGKCAISMEGDLFFQFTANAGLIIAF